MTFDCKNELLLSIDKIHTTPMGYERIRKNWYISYKGINHKE